MGILDNIKTIFSGAPISKALQQESSVLGIDIGSASIKVVQLKRSQGKAVLETYGAITLGPYTNTDAGRAVKLTPTKIAEALTDLIREANITTSSAAVAIPFASSLTSIIQMPKVPINQLNTMVPIEARKYIPLPTSEVTMDWFVIPEDTPQERGDMIRGVYDSSKESDPNKYLEVLLVAIHNSTLSDYQSIMSVSKLDTAFYELEVFSAARASLGHSTKPIVIVDIGASSTKIYVLENGIVRMSHMVNKGSQDLTAYVQRTLGITFSQAEKLKKEKGLSKDSTITLKDGSQVILRDTMLSTLDHIFAQINRVLLSYGKKYNKNISEVIFCGGSVVMNGFEEYAKSKINNVINISDPFRKVLTPAFLDEALREIGPEFAVATGLALRHLYNN